MKIDQQHMLRLALETGGSTRTVRRWLMGEEVSAFAAYALEAAAVKLDIPHSKKTGRVPGTKAAGRRAKR